MGHTITGGTGPNLGLTPYSLLLNFYQYCIFCVSVKAPFSRVYECWITSAVFQKNCSITGGTRLVTWGVAFNFNLWLVRDRHFVKSVWFLEEDMSRRTKICIKLFHIDKGNYLKIEALRVGHRNGSFWHTHNSYYRIHNPKQNNVGVVQEERWSDQWHNLSSIFPKTDFYRRNLVVEIGNPGSALSHP